MNQFAILAIQYLAVPIIRGVVSIAVKSLKKAPNGIPKKLALVMLEAVATNDANYVLEEDIESAKAKVSDIN